MFEFIFVICLVTHKITKITKPPSFVSQDHGKNSVVLLYDY